MWVSQGHAQCRQNKVGKKVDLPDLCEVSWCCFEVTYSKGFTLECFAPSESFPVFHADH